MKWFNRKEFACKCGCGFDTVDYELAEVLVDLREYFESPTTINSGCRCGEHNHSVGGSSNSMHLYGKAADVVVKGVSAEDVYEYLDTKYFNKYGIGLYTGRVHVDVKSGPKRRWIG